MPVPPFQGWVVLAAKRLQAQLGFSERILSLLPRPSLSLLRPLALGWWDPYIVQLSFPFTSFMLLKAI